MAMHGSDEVKSMNAERLGEILQAINEIGATEEFGVTRLAYTKEHWAANEWFIRQCREEGLSVTIDACGNVIARREGSDPDLPAVACGSHLDTVQNGGRYDGTLGVAAGLEVVKSLNERGIATRHPIEIISFACEESARFGVSTIGSKAMAGLIDKERLRELADRDGVTFPEALAEVSLDFENIESAARRKEELKAFLELHIEQGPVLENGGLQVGIATGIAAPTRFELTIQGKASHSGTTPMNMRKDALIGAAEIITRLEEAALAEASHGTVATAGVCEVTPGAMNVVPDRARLKIDIRGTDKASRRAVLERISAAVADMESRRGLAASFHLLSDEEPVSLDGQIAAYLTRRSEELGLAGVRMVSGAGHDAMNMARLCPTGLIFIPSREGISHHKDEFSSLQQIANGVLLLEEAILHYAEVVREGGTS